MLKTTFNFFVQKYISESESNRPLSKGLVTWTRPALPATSGCGSWNDWSYKIFIEESSGTNLTFGGSEQVSGNSTLNGESGLTGSSGLTELTGLTGLTGLTKLTGLSGRSESESFSFLPKPDTIYRVRVRPVSEGGEGPVSEPVFSSRFDLPID